MEAIKNAKELKNVSQLKFFFGLPNYCHRHFQSLCSTGTFSLFIKKKYEMVLRIDCFWGSPKYSRWNKIISSLWRYKTFNISFPCFTTPAGCSCFIKCKIVKKKTATFTSSTLSKAKRSYSQSETEALPS